MRKREILVRGGGGPQISCTNHVPFYSMQNYKSALYLILVGTDALASLLGGSLDRLLALEDSSDTGKSGLDIIREKVI